MEKFALLYRPELREYDFGWGHPCHGDRHEVFRQFLSHRFPADDNYQLFSAEPATGEDLRLICQPDYIDFTTGYFQAAQAGLSYPGQFYQYHSADNMPRPRPGRLEAAARLIVGQAKMACDLVLRGQFRKAVSLGGGLHHAKPDYGEGFCLYNDVAFCATYLMQEYQLDRILILDTDAHAGNGTADYFYNEPRVLLIDLHQDPRTLYPATGFAHQIGAAAGRGFTVNIPLPVYAGDDSYRLVFDSLVAPLVREFQPQIIVRNGGADPHFADGLTNLGISLKGLRMFGEKTRQMAEACDGKVVDLIFSGYNEKILPYGWLALLFGLAGADLEIEEPEPIPSRLSPDPALAATGRVIAEVRNQLQGYWECLR